MRNKNRNGEFSVVSLPEIRCEAERGLPNYMVVRLIDTDNDFGYEILSRHKTFEEARKERNELEKFQRLSAFQNNTTGEQDG